MAAGSVAGARPNQISYLLDGAAELLLQNMRGHFAFTEARQADLLREALRRGGRFRANADRRHAKGQLAGPGAR